MTMSIPKRPLTIRSAVGIAANYLMDRFPVPAIRFDVVAVSVASGHLAGIRHMVGAFDWEAEP